MLSPWRKAFVSSLDPQSLRKPRRGSRARDADATAALRDAEPRAHLPLRLAREPLPRSPRSQSARSRSARRRPLRGPHRGRLPPPPPGRAQELRRLRGSLPAEPRRERAGAAVGQGRWGAAKRPAGQPAGGCGGGGPGGRGGARAAGRPAETCPGPRAPGSAPSTSATTKPANVMVPVPPARFHLPFSSRPGCEGGRRGRGVPLIPPAAHPPSPPRHLLSAPLRAGEGRAPRGVCRYLPLPSRTLPVPARHPPRAPRWPQPGPEAASCSAVSHSSSAVPVYPPSSDLIAVPPRFSPNASPSCMGLLYSHLLQRPCPLTVGLPRPLSHSHKGQTEPGHRRTGARAASQRRGQKGAGSS